MKKIYEFYIERHIVFESRKQIETISPYDSLTFNNQDIKSR